MPKAEEGGNPLASEAWVARPLSMVLIAPLFSALQFRPMKIWHSFEHLGFKTFHLNIIPSVLKHPKEWKMPPISKLTVPNQSKQYQAYNTPYIFMESAGKLLGNCFSVLLS